MKYNFEWDPEKAEINKRKHNVSFEEAATAFKDPNSLSLFDERHSRFEERWITLGLSNARAPDQLVRHETGTALDGIISVLSRSSARSSATIQNV